MTETGLQKVSVTAKRIGLTMLLGMPLIAGGCVNISAPDKPIQINLNINVTQEVVYRLDNEAKSLIKQNPGIF
ncbi:YnbE family lipoprotein [Sphingomonas sp.]|jgi:hypothetical protein|uniref:YnbE family lipoprotein n=1 Tax=Sphingomonas sp. TaxID=28214 RepID=UPI0035C7DC9B